MLASAIFSTLLGAAAVFTTTSASAVLAPTYEFCGGFAAIQCKDPAQKCYDDPRDKCDPKNGGFDCGGICLGPDDIDKCGGILGRRCPTGTRCFNYPDDECSPGSGADCIGFCV